MLEAKQLYDSLLESGLLFSYYKKMKGSWDLDKKLFEKQYEEDQQLIKDSLNNIYIDDDDVYQDF